MIDYSKSKIYKIEPICDYEEGDIYIGSTTKKYLSDRMAEHRADFKRGKQITSCIILEKFGVENCKIILIEEYPCNSKDALVAKEAEYIRTLKCINKVIPDRTKQEYDKSYHQKMKHDEDYIQKRNIVRKQFEKTEIRNHKFMIFVFFNNFCVTPYFKTLFSMATKQIP